MIRDKILLYMFGLLLFPSKLDNNAYAMDRDRSVYQDHSIIDRTHMTWHGQLGVYHLMIVSKYFLSINDYQNLELATSKAYGNMGKFHYNPLPLTRETKQFFPSLETLHVYNKNDDHFEDEEFFRRIIHYEVNYSEYLQKKKDNETYKNVVLTQNDVSLHNLRSIPDGVTKIGQGAFKSCDVLSKLTIPRMVSISEEAFSWYQDLQKLAISEGVSIGKRAFSDCYNLSELTISEGVLIGEGAFKACDGLSELTFPKLVSIGEEAFSGCLGLRKLTISERVSIGEGAFKACDGLSELTISERVSIGNKAFCQCYGLSELTISEGVSIGEDAFYWCENLQELTISKGVSIGEEAFSCCFGLRKLTISEGVSIGEEAFFRCSNLTSVSIKKRNGETITKKIAATYDPTEQVKNILKEVSADSSK